MRSPANPGRFNPENVALVYRHLPHTEASSAAARAAECAADQGMFWEYHDRLYSSSSAWQYGNTKELLSVVAATVNVPNMNSFESCLDADGTVPAVTADQTTASDARITATPTFLVNGRMLRGVLDSVRFDDLYADMRN